ncbi:1-phosphatidylinositol-3-phosphate 5-kinase [Sarracenia purpurea var. burkii]
MPNGLEGSWNSTDISRESSVNSTLAARQSFSLLDSDYVHSKSYGSEDSSSREINSLFTDAKNSSHLRISFEEESLIAGGKVKFFVTCYFAKQFYVLRKKCCPSEVDFIHSLSRCKRWSAQGGKSNAYFKKSLDDRFIIKQVQKTELESFEEFAPEHFKYLTDSLGSGCPTHLIKVLASVDMMDYSLLVGVDDECEELVIGIIDFMRQYTCDKHLETWVKTSGIPGGLKNASPTIVYPKQYKKRFRKAMTTYSYDT